MMKEILKKIAIVGSGVALLSGTAFASVGNSGTGKNSENEVDFTSRNRTTVTTNNDADVYNDVDASASTGWNSIFDMVWNKDNHDNHDRHDRDDEDENAARGDASISTGNASATANVTNRVNGADIHVSMPSSDFGDLGNRDTGKNSENEVEAHMSNTLRVTTNNNADVHNDVDVTANTGHNMISGGGAGDKSIDTGNASASVSVSNTVNSTTVSVK